MTFPLCVTILFFQWSEEEDAAKMRPITTDPAKNPVSPGFANHRERIASPGRCMGDRRRRIVVRPSSHRNGEFICKAL
jgi:hypothetical protein